MCFTVIGRCCNAKCKLSSCCKQEPDLPCVSADCFGVAWAVFAMLANNDSQTRMTLSPTVFKGFS